MIYPFQFISIRHADNILPDVKVLHVLRSNIKSLFSSDLKARLQINPNFFLKNIIDALFYVDFESTTSTSTSYQSQILTRSPSVLTVTSGWNLNFALKHRALNCQSGASEAEVTSQSEWQIWLLQCIERIKKRLDIRQTFELKWIYRLICISFMC